MYKYIITLFILFLSFNLFSQDHHYHAICVDSLQVPYEYNSYKQNADGSITFYQISSTLNDIHFNKFTLSQDLAFSDLETFYTDQIDYSIYTYHNHVFNNDYFYIHSWHGDMCYVFNNDQLISILDYHSNYLPIDSNHIIYYSSSKIYKINISTNEIDSLSFGTYNGIVGLLPYTDHQFLVKHDYDMYHSNILVINEDLTVSDTVTVNEDVQVDIFDQLVFNPYHATIYQHDNYTLITAQNYYLEGGTALIVLNVEHQIVYANSPVGEYHDFIDLDPNSVAFLFHSDGLGNLLLLYLDANVYEEAIPVIPVPDRQFYNVNGFIISLSFDYSHYSNQVGVSSLQDYPDNTFTPMNEQYFFYQTIINYWDLADSCFLIDFNPGFSHYIRKFRVTGTTVNHDASAIQNFSLKCYPNPFHSNLTIEYHSKIKSQEAQVEIFNIKGQLVRSYKLDEGASIKWDRKDKFNRYVSAGVYLVNLKTNNEVRRINKILLLK